MYDQNMSDGSDIPRPDGEPDPELVELMRERVVRRKSTRPKNPKPGPGRPKGCTKPPGSGKRAGRPNLMSPEFRAWLSKRAKPFELLAKICRGDEIMDGDAKRRPTVAERMRAAETLTRKIIPDLQATKAEVSGPDGAPLGGAELSDFEAARVIAFALTRGLMEQEASVAVPKVLSSPQRQPEEAQGAGPASPSAAEPAPPVLPVGHEEQAGSYVLRLVDRLPDDRERWTAHDENGRLAGTAFGRDRLLAQLVGDT